MNILGLCCQRADCERHCAGQEIAQDVERPLYIHLEGGRRVSGEDFTRLHPPTKKPEPRRRPRWPFFLVICAAAMVASGVVAFF